MKYKKHDLIDSVNNDFKYYCKNCEQNFKTKPKLVCPAKIETKKQMGKHSRAAGKRFELKVREDLIKNGWIVFRNLNDVVFANTETQRIGEFRQSKSKWNPFTKRPITLQSGFPDFICIKLFPKEEGDLWLVRFVECKINGNLDKIEKEKAEWIKTKLKIPVIIASKSEGEIKYENV
jgi:hypothetical protein